MTFNEKDTLIRIKYTEIVNTLLSYPCVIPEMGEVTNPRIPHCAGITGWINHIMSHDFPLYEVFLEDLFKNNPGFEKEYGSVCYQLEDKKPVPISINQQLYVWQYLGIDKDFEKDGILDIAAYLTVKFSCSFFQLSDKCADLLSFNTNSFYLDALFKDLEEVGPTWKSQSMSLFLKVLLSNRRDEFISTLVNTSSIFKEKLAEHTQNFIYSTAANPVKDYMLDLSLAIEINTLHSLYGIPTNETLYSLLYDIAYNSDKK